MSDDLFEHDLEETMSREQAAKRLRQLADALEHQNKLRVTQHGKDVTVMVADQVQFELEIEIEKDDESEIEIKLTW